MLSFNAVKAKCPAAATEGKARKTTQGDYVAYPTRKLFNMATAAGFKCVEALQGPSIKKAYVPFARHMMVFDKTPNAGPGTPSGAPPRFRLVVTNSHNGLTPLMFIPAIYIPAHDVTLYASAFAVFHRQFTDETTFDNLVLQAFDAAVVAETQAMLVWRKLLRASLTPRQAAAMFRLIINHHGGCVANVPAAQLDVNGMSAGNVAAATLSGYIHGRFKSKLPGGKERAIYPSRAIVRIERAAFGAWYEACRMAYGKDAPNIELEPFNVTPMPKGEGVRRKSAPVIMTGAAEEAAAD
jgi:hypothetical protein